MTASEEAFKDMIENYVKYIKVRYVNLCVLNINMEEFNPIYSIITFDNFQ